MVVLFFIASICFGSSVGKTEAPSAVMTSPPFAANDPFSKKISLDLRDMDMVDVLKFISIKGKFNIVMNRSVAGRVTLILKEVSIGDALDIILRANGLAYNRINNIVHIMTAEQFLNTYGRRFNDESEVEIINLNYAKPSYVLAALDNLKSNVGRIVIDEDAGSVVLIDTRESLDRMLVTLHEMDHENETRVFQLNHAIAADLAAQLKTRLDAKSVGSVEADVRSNQLLVSALPGRMAEVERLIKKLDKPIKAVLIKVRILKITLNPKFDYGIDWSNFFGRQRIGALDATKISHSSAMDATTAAVGTLSTFSFGLNNLENFQLKIQALKQVVDSKIIATPRLMVAHNEEAKIHIGDTIPYVTSTTTGTGDTATVSESINFIDVGIKLSVTPTISDDGFVKLKIRPEISSQTLTVETPQKAKIPQVNTTFVDTTVVIQDGYTVVIGGLRQLTNKQTYQGMPRLMHLPLIGKLFRNETYNILSEEIVVFLTPEIVTGKKNIVDANDAIEPDQDFQVDAGGGIFPDRTYGSK